MTSIKIKANIRENTGSIAAKKIKRANQIPAVIYSNPSNINISLDSKELEHEYFKGDLQSTIISLDLDGKELKVVAHKIELDPVSDRPIHIDFFNCDKQKTIKIQSKIKFTGQDKSIGLKRGGFLNVRMRKVALEISADKEIPNFIEVDISLMKVGQKIRASDLKIPEYSKLNVKGANLVASITGRASKEDSVATDSASTTSKVEEKKPSPKK
ncbi:MAG: 50S ribosomal protein L25/general stress protein Ctc [Rickettsiales bacterium]|nr:50S ribosomal protein L25/general stress protein Ctc [Rickettsiales bacterium]